jgi:hypothetical protein
MAGTLSSERAARIGRIGGLVTSSRTDGFERTQAARDTFRAQFLDQVDPDHKLPEAERLRRAEAARKAHMARLALKSAEVRKARVLDPVAA